MAKIVLIIDGSIGPYGFSKQWLNYMLQDHDNDEIEACISSLGGSVDHAISMHDRLAAHGNSTAILTGMVASSATIIALSSKLTKMSQNSLYLIHKPMTWIDEWGTLNEDDIDALIAKLGKDKNDLGKVTLVIAKMYATKTGKPVKDILDLMKQETWLTADEAKEWGFVDEVFTPSKIVNYADDMAMIAMIHANGYPVPGVINQMDDEGIIARVTEKIKDFLKPKHIPKPIEMKKQFLNLNKSLKVDKLESSDEGVYLNEDQLAVIDQEIEARAAADTARTTAENSLTSANTALDSIDETVSTAATIAEKVTAIKALLAAKPGSKPAGTKGADQHPTNDGVDWDTLNALPHMQDND